MNVATFPMLSLILFLPFVGALAIAIINSVEAAKKIALLTAIVELIATLIVTFSFDAEVAGFSQIERYRWIPNLNAEFLLGVDGISVLFLPASALLTLITILASWNNVNHLSRLHFALLLILESVTLGVFTALDMLLFFLFWEATLPPIFFLIGLWGIGPQRRAAALKYTLFMLFGGVPLLFAIIVLATNHATQTGELSFSFLQLLQTSMPDNLQLIVFLLLVLGFAVKAPLVPFHTWLPTFSMQAPTQLSALLAGLKLGIFGLLRFAFPLAPQAAVHYAWMVALLGAVTLVYAALIALKQTNLRELFAYLSISHVGLVVLGIASLNEQSLQGVIFQLLNFSLIASSLMLLAGFMQQRFGSTELIHLGGLAKVMPKMTALFFLFSLASIGMPLTSGFPAEMLLIIGVMKNHLGLGVAALCGAVLGASALLMFIRGSFLGTITHDNLKQASDLRPREWLILGLPILLVLIFGLFPQIILDTTKHAAQFWLSRFIF